MKVALPALRASGNASIINTSSVLGIIGGGAAAYHASKAAVRLLNKTASFITGAELVIDGGLTAH